MEKERQDQDDDAQARLITLRPVWPIDDPSPSPGTTQRSAPRLKSGSRQARRSDSHGGEHGERDPDETVAWRLMLAWHPSREFSRADHRRKTAAQASRTVSERAARSPERPTNSSSGPAHVKPSPSGSTASLAATTCLRQPPRLTLPICLLRNTGCSDNRITRHRVFLHHLDLEKILSSRARLVRPSTVIGGFKPSWGNHSANSQCPNP